MHSSSGSRGSERREIRMDVEAAIASTVNVQEAFRTLTLLQLTYHLFPKPAELSGEHINCLLLEHIITTTAFCFKLGNYKSQGR